MKPMTDGERRVMKKSVFSDGNLDVIAHRVDCDTPYVIIKCIETGIEFTLTDSGAKELVERIQRALKQLPTSK